MEDSSDFAELVVGMTISTGALISRLVINLRDANVITEDHGRQIILDLADHQRTMASQPGVAGGAAAIYSSVADTLDATIGRLSESSGPSS